MTVELGASGQPVSRLRAPVDGMGDFTLRGVSPGQYELRVIDGAGAVLYRRDVIVQSDAEFFAVRIDSPRVERPVSGTISARSLGRRSPGKAVKAFDKGRQAADKGDLAAAAGHFREATEMDAKFAEAYANLGACYARLNRDEDALAALERAGELDPGLTVVYTNMSQLLLRMKRYREAEQSARAALRQEPSSDAAHFLLGASLKMQGKNETEALASLRQAASIPAARLYAAEILAQRGERQRAAGELRAYLSSSAPEQRATIEAWIARLEQ